MTERYTRPQFSPLSLEYGLETVEIAAESLRRKVNDLIDSGDPMIEVQIKTDPLGANSPVTEYDKQTELLIGSLYEGTGVRIIGEENTSRWAKNETPSIEVHVDPIDGTKLFINYVQSMIERAKNPEDERPPQPICGSMVSAGGILPGSNHPKWGAIAAPFIDPDGIVLWAAGGGRPAVRIEPDGSQHEIPPASALRVPETGGVVLVSSNSTEQNFGESLQDAGYKVVKYKSAVAAALCVMDQTLFGRLVPPGLNDPVVGAVMRTANNWDVAGAYGIADRLGHFVSNTRGEPRTFEEGSRSAIFSVNETIGRTLINAIAPHLSK